MRVADEYNKPFNLGCLFSTSHRWYQHGFVLHVLGPAKVPQARLLKAGCGSHFEGDDDVNGHLQVGDWRLRRL